jgi:hypothetical protein
MEAHGGPAPPSPTIGYASTVDTTGRSRKPPSHQGWIVSLPGDVNVRIDCVPGSTLPADLRALGYDVTATGDGERILPHQIVERFTRRADGELEPLTEGSTKPVAQTRTHAGIVRVERYAFDMP